MKHVRYIIYTACSVVFLLSSKNVEYTNSLTKFFFHKSEISDKIVCYFNKEPICNRMPQKKSFKLETDVQSTSNGFIKQIRFFMPLTKIVGEARRSIPNISRTSNEHYAISFTEVNKPLRGVQVNIEYYPQHIAFEVTKTFDAINNKYKGVVFTFHDKNILQKLNKKTNHILRYASNKNKVPTIVIDSGHGGNDDGKIVYNFHNVIKEKDITLQVGNHLARLLKKKGYNVVVTRKSDIYVPLDMRTTLANQKQADLFISIHANSALNKTVSGIETYWTPHTLLKKEMYDIDAQSKYLIAYVCKQKDCASKRLASCIHTNVLVQANKFYTAKDRNIKEAVAQVLLGTDMPAILIEIDFLTSEKIKWLVQSSYQLAIAQGICTGIEAYLKEV